MRFFVLSFVVLSIIVINAAVALKTPCSGSFSNGADTYTVAWDVDPDDGYVNITITARNNDNTWVGFGASLTPNMPNSDIALGSWQSDTVYFVHDRYASGQSIPAIDTMQNLDNVMITRENGYTVIFYTRALNTGDSAQDVNLEECVHLLWAMNGPVNDYTSNPPNIGRHTGRAAFPDMVCFNDCAETPDVVPAVTTTTTMPVVTPIVPVPVETPVVTPVVPVPDPCWGYFYIPNTFFFLWHACNGYVNITFSATNMDDTWIGLGFSLTPNMPNSDIVLGSWQSDTVYFVHDRYASSQTQPAIDEVQNLENVAITRVDGNTTISFTRALDTGDSAQDISLNQCVHVLWAMNGPVNDYTTDPPSIGGHAARGVFSDMVCLNNCTAPGGAATVAISFASLLIAALASFYLM